MTAAAGHAGAYGVTKVRRAATPSEALGFIGRHPHVYLLARRADGYPTGYAMMAKVCDAGVDFSTYRASVKVKNLLRDGVAAILAVSDDADDDRVLYAEGQVSLLQDATFVEETSQLDEETSRRQPCSSSRKPAVPAEITEKVSARHEAGKRCVLRMTIERADFSTRLA